MADIHRTRNSAVTVLLKKPPSLAIEQKGAQPKELKEINEPSDYIGLTDKGRVVYFSSKADMEDSLSISKSLLKSYSSLTLYTKLLDAHFYIFSRWTLDVLEKHEKQIASIKGEFVPFLVKLQYRQKFQSKNHGVPENVLNVETLASTLSSAPERSVDELGCFAYVMTDGFCARVNTINSYLEVNKEVATGNTGYLPFEKPGKNNFIHETALIDPKTQIAAECVVGESTTIAERCGVMKSTIGKHCKIGNNVKIRNSIIMDYVTIMEGCTIQNSIICNRVYMKEKCSIQDCQVGVSYNFVANSKHKGESLVAEGE